MGLLALVSWLVAVSVFQINDSMAASSPLAMAVGYVCVAIGCTLFLGSILGLPKNWLPKPLIHLGKISYGLYVFHMLSLDLAWKLLWPSDLHRSPLHAQSWPFLLAARAALILLTGLGMTTALALLSYRFLERPFLTLKERFTFIPSRSV
jgi:peptidoglycan/LPS O-acetylase OafA/YrhL